MDQRPGMDRERDPTKRVVVTGMGVVSPLGTGLEEFWTGATTGRSGIRRITLCDPSPYPCQVAGEVPDFDPLAYMDARDARRMARGSQFAVVAAREAVAHAGFGPNQLPDDTGVLVGQGNSSFPDLEAATRVMIARGGMKISPFAMSAVLPSMSGAQIAMQLGARGYNSTVSTACAAGTQALGEAVEVLRRGDAEIMIAGGQEAPISELGLAGFSVIRALSTGFNDEPWRASRPFDNRRTGFVSGEGAGMMVLETLDHARRRGAQIHGELLAYAATNDAFHVTAPDPESRGAIRAMAWALKRARVAVDEVDYINAHGTGTPQNDQFETKAIKSVFGEHAYRLAVSSTKSMIGHCLGAAGAIEAIATILALREQVLPPTINLDEPDPCCDLDYVPKVARPAEVRTAISNSFGFGGQNATLVLARFDER